MAPVLQVSGNGNAINAGALSSSLNDFTGLLPFLLFALSSLRFSRLGSCQPVHKCVALRCLSCHRCVSGEIAAVAHTFTLTNIGNSDLTLFNKSIIIWGPNAANFSLVAQPRPWLLHARASTTFSIKASSNWQLLCLFAMIRARLLLKALRFAHC